MNSMRINLILILCGLAAAGAIRAEDKLFARDNLVAWCIVPYDAAKRGPEERAAMLERLGFSHFAYDWRAPHVPTFDAEVEALAKHHIELSAWWFPTSLNKDAQTILDVLARHGVKTQLWVACGGSATVPATDADRAARIETEAAKFRPIGEAAEKQGCSLELYSHGGWLGEPETMLSLVEALKPLKVGIVYSLFHADAQLDRLPGVLKKMLPHLRAINLIGIDKTPDKTMRKVVGQGELDLEILKIIRDSGFTGRLGLVNHTDEDAEARLKANLDGLDKLKPQLQAK